MRARPVCRVCLVVAGAAAIIAGAAAVRRHAGVAVSGRGPAERIASIERLARERRAGAGEAIAAAATSEAHALVRQAALMAMEGFIEPRYRPAVEAGTRDIAPLARAAAARTLCRYGDDRAAMRLGELLATDFAETVRTDAAEGLARIGTPAAVGLLAEAAEKNDYPPLRRVALGALEGLLERHRPGGPEPWHADRWERLSAEIGRLRPLVEAAATQPAAGGEHAGHEHGPPQTRPGR